MFLFCDEDGILLLEINRMLRAGGYFAWAAQPVYKHEAALEEQWTGNNPFILCGYGERFFRFHLLLWFSQYGLLF